MAWNGSGVYSRTNGTNTGSALWAADRDDGTKITADRHDTHDEDIATAINNCLAKDGQNAMTGALDLNGQELVLDVDGDTSITADTDDQIDVKIAGADDFQFTANTFTALSGSTIDATPGTLDVTDARFSIKDDADATKIAKFQASAITTGTTRTITLPDADTTIPATFYTDPITTRGDIIRGDASGNVERLALGAADTALVSDGTDIAYAGIRKQGKETIFVPAAAMRATVSNGAAAIGDVETTAGRPDMTAFDFDASADEHVQFQVAMPKSWNLGTVTAQFFWESTAADTDGVTWAIQGVAVSDNETIDVAYGTAVTVDDANQSAAEELLVSAESGAITIAGTPADDDLCFFRVFRDVSDANDTATEDARLLGVKLFITTDAGDDT